MLQPWSFPFSFLIRTTSPLSQSGRVVSDCQMADKTAWNPIKMTTSSFQLFRADVTNTSCFSTPQPCTILFWLLRERCGLVNEWTTILYFQLSSWELPAENFRQLQLLRIVIHSPTHPRNRVGEEIFQGLVQSLEVFPWKLPSPSSVKPLTYLSFSLFRRAYSYVTGSCSSLIFQRAWHWIFSSVSSEAKPLLDLECFPMQSFTV